MENYIFEIPSVNGYEKKSSFELIRGLLLNYTENVSDQKDLKMIVIDFLSNVNSLSYIKDYKSDQIPFKAIKSTEPEIAFYTLVMGLMKSLFRFFNEEGVEVKPQFLTPRNQIEWLPDYNEGKFVKNSLTQVMRACNANCAFCYTNSDPISMATCSTNNNLDDIEFDKILSYDEHSGKMSYQIQFNPREIFSNKNAIKHLQQIRAKSNRSFYLVSNGLGITENVVKELKKISNVSLILSVNTLNEESYKDLMDVEAEKCKNSLKVMKWLNENNFPFGASVVAIGNEDFLKNDLRLTIQKICEYNPAFIRINLPGYTRESEWITKNYLKNNDILSILHNECIGKYSIPIFPIPSYSYLSFLKITSPKPYVYGVINNSPASNIIKTGDIIVSVNDIEITDTVFYKKIMQLFKGHIKFNYLRNGNKEVAEININENASYPYNGSGRYGKYFFPAGIVVSDGVDINNLISAITGKISCVHKIFVFCSKFLTNMIKTQFEITCWNVEENVISKMDKKIILINPENYYFGGNIHILDMLTCQDIQTNLVNAMEKYGNPDDVLIYDSFLDEDGYDLLGVSRKMLNNLFDFNITFIKHERITF